MIHVDLTGYWYAVGVILVVLAGHWSFKKVRSLFGR